MLALTYFKFYAKESSRSYMKMGEDDSPFPAGSWDTHLHTFDPAKHPYESDSPYFPLASSIQSAMSHIPANNLVFVMAKPEGTRPANVLECVAFINNATPPSNQERKRQARATAVLDFTNSMDEKLQKLREEGVRSVRIHTREAVTKGLSGDEALEQYIETKARRIAPLGWTLDGQLKTEQWVKFAPQMKRLHKETGIEFVADHHFYLKAGDYGSDKYATIVALIESGTVYTKICGLMQRRDPKQDIEELKPVFLGLAAAAGGNKAIYGSDWPHVVSGGGSSEVLAFDEKAEAAIYRRWFGEELFRKIIVDNPARLYA